MITILINSVPPSVNAMYINRPRGQKGRGRILSKEAREFKEAVTADAHNAFVDVELESMAEYGLFLRVCLPRRCDISNIIKIVEDAIFAAIDIDDRQNSLIVVSRVRESQYPVVAMFGYKQELVKSIGTLLQSGI